jgi:hypothetical protein
VLLTNPVASKNIYFVPRNYLQDAVPTCGPLVPVGNATNSGSLRDGTSREQTSFRGLTPPFGDYVVWTFASDQTISAVGIYGCNRVGVNYNKNFHYSLLDSFDQVLYEGQFTGADYGAYKLILVPVPGVRKIKFQNTLGTLAWCGEMYAGQWWQPENSFGDSSGGSFDYEPGVIGEDQASDYEALNRDVHGCNRQFTLHFGAIKSATQVAQWEAMHLESQKHVLVDTEVCHYKAYPAMVVINNVVYQMMLPMRLPFKIVKGQGHTLDLILTEEGHDL